MHAYCQYIVRIVENSYISCNSLTPGEINDKYCREHTKNDRNPSNSRNKKSVNQRKTRGSIRLLLFYINGTQVSLPPNLLFFGSLRIRFLPKYKMYICGCSVLVGVAWLAANTKIVNLIEFQVIEVLYSDAVYDIIH